MKKNRLFLSLLTFLVVTYPTTSRADDFWATLAGIAATTAIVCGAFVALSPVLEKITPAIENLDAEGKAKFEKKIEQYKTELEKNIADKAKLERDFPDLINFSARKTEEMNRRIQAKAIKDELGPKLKHVAEQLCALNGTTPAMQYVHWAAQWGSFGAGAYWGNKFYNNYLAAYFATTTSSVDTLLKKITALEAHTQQLQAQQQRAKTGGQQEKYAQLQKKLEETKKQIEDLNAQLADPQEEVVQKNIMVALGYGTQLATVVGCAFLTRAVMYHWIFCSLFPPGRVLSEEEQQLASQLMQDQTTWSAQLSQAEKEYLAANATYVKLNGLENTQEKIYHTHYSNRIDEITEFLESVEKEKKSRPYAVLQNAVELLNQ